MWNGAECESHRKGVEQQNTPKVGGFHTRRVVVVKKVKLVI